MPRERDKRPNESSGGKSGESRCGGRPVERPAKGSGGKSGEGPLRIYVPSDRAPSLSGIAAGSAIVGGRIKAVSGWTTIDYEGNIYGSAGLRRYANRVEHAAGRHAARYPTVARRWVGSSELLVIGDYDETAGEVRLFGERERELLCEWLGVSELAEGELQAEGARFEMRREIIAALKSDDPARRFEAERLRRRYGIDL